MATKPEEPTGKALWQTADGALQIGHCLGCDTPHYYPRTVCPFCFSFDVELRAASGKGSIYSHSFTPRGPSGPYVLAYVTLDEGVSMLTNIVDAAPESVTIGQRVEVVFRDVGGISTPYFTPA